ncbi:hypothetical protein ACFFX0_10995 [Citricoccus parietis]|uniref:Uncharacterized protein n=1 Tax=Citricoccus parietis TaxID=592307 RepID=A0ABV5FYE2_9MICC
MPRVELEGEPEGALEVGAEDALEGGVESDRERAPPVLESAFGFTGRSHA